MRNFETDNPVLLLLIAAVAILGVAATVLVSVEAVTVLFANHDLFDWVPKGATHTERILFGLLLLVLARQS